MTPERLYWAFRVICTDPDFVFGTMILKERFPREIKAFLVEVYIAATGRKILTPAEETALREILEP